MFNNLKYHIEEKFVMLFVASIATTLILNYFMYHCLMVARSEIRDYVAKHS